MALEIVDVLEVVDVHQGHAGIARRAFAAAHGIFQRQRHGTAVGQAGQHVGAALFGQVGILCQQHVVVLAQQALVVIAFEHVLLDVQCEAAQFHHHHHLARQRGQGGGLFRVQVLRGGIEHPQGAQRQAIAADQRRTGVEADVRIAGHRRVVMEAHVFAGVFHHHDFVRAQDGVAAHRFAAQVFGAIQPLHRLEPLAFGVDQGHRGHAGAAQRAGDDHQVIEGFLTLRIEDAVAVQRLQALSFVGRLVGLDHAASCSGRSLRILAEPDGGWLTASLPAPAYGPAYQSTWPGSSPRSSCSVRLRHWPGLSAPSLMLSMRTRRSWVTR
ncbi:MAG: hypothetical protein GAK43_00401 [Stenotrophomonas maltophilia]|nr:MAG: hypothetical protein GAK43_00401 [Stenotrophomonas maltophilia]